MNQNNYLSSLLAAPLCSMDISLPEITNEPRLSNINTPLLSFENTFNGKNNNLIPLHSLLNHSPLEFQWQQSLQFFSLSHWPFLSFPTKANH